MSLTHGNDANVAPGRVVVVGAGGFVGGAIAARAKRAGLPVLSLQRSDIDLVQDQAGEQLAKALQPDDAMVLVSAQAPCRDIGGLEKNVKIISAICAALAKQPVVHVVNISSDAVYADEPALVSENDAAAPASMHGIMHRAREVAINAATQAPVLHLRSSLLYGARDPHNGYGPNRFRRTAAADGKIMLFGAGVEKRDHVFIDDVAEIAYLALMRCSRGILNIATGHSLSFREVADHVAALNGRPVEIENAPQKQAGTHRHFDVRERIRAFPEFVPTPFAKGIAVTMSAPETH